jgi:hypothetical protein
MMLLTCGGRRFTLSSVWSSGGLASEILIGADGLDDVVDFAVEGGDGFGQFGDIGFVTFNPDDQRGKARAVGNEMPVVAPRHPKRALHLSDMFRWQAPKLQSLDLDSRNGALDFKSGILTNQAVRRATGATLADEADADRLRASSSCS